ncbi:MAG: hypothetical protein N2511_01480 [Thermodesulfovibrionales bacterium]|nr:hypothetical protein [Thermodesulfovibrionales bacterium]
MKKLLLFFFLSIFLFNPPKILASFDAKGLQPLPPYGVFSTLSAETLKQNEIGFGFGIEKSSEPNFNRVYLQTAYALHDKFEINLTIPYVFNLTNGASGFEDFSLGIKHRLVNESKYSPAVAYLLIISVNTGKQNLSTEGGFGGGLLLTKKVGPFKGHLNLLYTKPERSGLKDQYLFNIGSELAITHKSQILAEIISRKNYFKNKLDLLEWRLGYRVKTGEDVYTNIGAGFDIKNRTPDYRLLFLISFIFPKQKAKSP